MPRHMHHVSLGADDCLTAADDRRYDLGLIGGALLGISDEMGLSQWQEVLSPPHLRALTSIPAC